MKATKALINRISELSNFDSFCSEDLYLTKSEAISGNYVIDGYMLKNTNGGFDFVAI